MSAEPSAGRSRVCGYPGYARYHVLASVTISSHEQARLMQELLVQAMRERAGKPEEAILAKWNNDLAKTRRDAERERWAGWD